jgi:putative transposase
MCVLGNKRYQKYILLDTVITEFFYFSFHLSQVPLSWANIQRWVEKFAPLLDKRFRTRKQNVNSSWRMDETYIKVKGQWCYL